MLKSLLQARKNPGKTMTENLVKPNQVNKPEKTRSNFKPGKYRKTETKTEPVKPILKSLPKPVPSKPKYSDIITRDESQINDQNTKEEEKFESLAPISTAIPNPGKTPYYRWEHAYFGELLDLYLHLYPDEVNELNPKRLDFFMKFLYNHSTGEISSYLDKMSDIEEIAFLQFLSKKR